MNQITNVQSISSRRARIKLTVIDLSYSSTHCLVVKSLFEKAVASKPINHGCFIPESFYYGLTFGTTLNHGACES